MDKNKIMIIVGIIVLLIFISQGNKKTTTADTCMRTTCNLDDYCDVLCEGLDGCQPDPDCEETICCKITPVVQYPIPAYNWVFPNECVTNIGTNREIVSNINCQAVCTTGTIKWDECNQCFCTTNGNWACSETYCPECSGVWNHGLCVRCISCCNTDADCNDNEKCIGGMCGITEPPVCEGGIFIGNCNANGERCKQVYCLTGPCPPMLIDDYTCETWKCTTNNQCYDRYKSCYYKCIQKQCDLVSTIPEDSPLYPNCSGEPKEWISGISNTIVIIGGIIVFIIIFGTMFKRK